MGRDRSKSMPRILIIDDEPEVAQMLADILATQGHQVVTADSGERALDLIEGQELLSILKSDPAALTPERVKSVINRNQSPDLPFVIPVRVL